MGFEDNVYRYLGLGVVILIAIYVLMKTLTFQGKIIEGLTNATSTTEGAEISLLNTVASKSTESITGQNNKLQDVLAVDKYRSDYENLIITLEEYTNIMMFSKVVGIGGKIANLSKGQAVTDDILSDVDKANKLKAFVETLNASMTFIDKTKKTSKMW